MSEQNHQPPAGDVFDRAAAAVRGQATPEPPADLAATVLNRLQLAEVRTRRRRWIVRGISIGGLAACLAVAVTWTGGRAYALDPVIQKMKAAESARFTVVQTLGDQKPLAQKHWLRGHQQRTELGDGATVIVTDYQKKQGLLTVPALKRYQRLPRPGAQIGVGDGRTPLDQFLAIRDAKAERLGKELVGGVNADKLKVERPAKPETGEMASTWTVWLDPATTLPVKIVSAGRAVAGDKEVAAESVFTDFAWNEKFPDTLFSLEPPEDYTDGLTAKRVKPERTHPVSLRVAVENQEAAKSYRAVVRSVLPGGKVMEQKLYGAGPKGRIEVGDLVTVGDGGTGALVLFDTKNKVARVADAGYVKRAAGNPEVAAAVKQLLEQKPAEDLGESYLDGRKVHTYRMKGLTVGGQAMDVTYTVDARRELPVRVELTLAGGPLAMTQTIDYLGFDEELDPKLFDLTVPAGYKREELKLPEPPKK